VVDNSPATTLQETVVQVAAVWLTMEMQYLALGAQEQRDKGSKEAQIRLLPVLIVVLAAAVALARKVVQRAVQLAVQAVMVLLHQ
jgi:hypothetical protein